MCVRVSAAYVNIKWFLLDLRVSSSESIIAIGGEYITVGWNWHKRVKMLISIGPKESATHLRVLKM